MTRFRETVAKVSWLLTLVFITFVQPLYLLPIEQQLPITLMLVMIGLFYHRPFIKVKEEKGKQGSIPMLILDSLFVVAAIVVGLYITLNYHAIIYRQGAFTAMDAVISVVAVVLVFDAVRRAVGWPLTIVCLVALAYALLGRLMPGALFHRGYSVNRISLQLALSYSGIYGIPLQIMVRYVILFIVFGALLQVSGAADFLVRFSTSFAGRYTGGLGKVAVVASGLVGSISGSAAGNVATTGSVTIPAMKGSGYEPHLAASVEAVASTGGQIMPPIMGAAAFLMADYLGIPYIQVVKAAVIPAFLYFFSAGAAIDIYARSKGIVGLPKDKIPPFWNVIKTGWVFLALILLVYGMLIAGASPTLSAFAGTMAAALLIVVRRVGMKALIDALYDGAQSAAKLCAVTAGAGIVVGIIQLTGLGAQLASFMVEVSQGHVFVLLILVMFASIIMGMGMPTTVVYVLLAALVAPALVALGIDVVGAHFFFFYFGVLAAITPPVALASYAAASIAKSDFDKTGWTAFKMALPAFIVPFFFVMNPALLMNGSVLQIMYAAFTSAIGVWMISVATMNYFRGKLPLWARAVIILGAISLIGHSLVTDIAGYLVLAGLIFFGMKRKQASPKQSEPSKA
nr:TRAP transporter fused permease subunit [uncultured Sphaerochaeta sp.]